MQHIPLRLKQIRVQLGLTQTEMATKLGMVQQTWQKLETGKVPDMRASTIIHICTTLKISADWLLGLTGEESI